MDNSIISEMINGDPNTPLDDRLFYQFTLGLKDEIDSNGFISVNRIADYIGKPRSTLRQYLKIRGPLTYGLANEIWAAAQIIGLGYSSEQPILNKHQLEWLRRIGKGNGIGTVDRACAEAGVVPKGRFERVMDDKWFQEYNYCLKSKMYTQSEIIARCAAYTFSREEWLAFRKTVEPKFKKQYVRGRNGKDQIKKMVKEMGREWVCQIMGVPVATLLSRVYRTYEFSVIDYLKIKAEYDKPENKVRLRVEVKKEWVERDLVNDELLPFIEQRIVIDGKERKAINAIRLARLCGLSYQQFRSRVYMGARMTVEEYGKIFEMARLLFKEAEECV